jgi:hypothetical protein
MCSAASAADPPNSGYDLDPPPRLLPVTDPKRCIFPTAGGPHAQLATEILKVSGPAFQM